MAGIYIHIPFCASRCIYCGFFSSTLLEKRQRYVDAVCKEMQLRKDYLHEPIKTIYLGGGTPSQLTIGQLHQLFDCLKDTFQLEYDSLIAKTNRKLLEVTMECNPDDVTEDFAQSLKALPVNRVSMGIQTFSDQRLRFLRRRHTAAQTADAVKRLRHAGIGNISIDLMYGFPNETIDDWQEDIRQALALEVEHLSAYSLMYEEDTPLYRMLEQGQVKELDEEVALAMYAELISQLSSAGYEHYEISNFAKPSFHSRHNSSYWHSVPYLGLGAAAHSYDQESRQWNIDNIDEYIAGIESGNPKISFEELDETKKYNELIMTSLRTKEGLLLERLSNSNRNYCLSQARRFLDDGLLMLSEGSLSLTQKGIFVSNMIMSDLMMVSPQDTE